MKKILIVSHALELGGAERALLGLMDSIDYTKYEVDLFLLRQEGELLPYINSNVRLLPEIPEYTVLARPMTQTMKEGHVLLTMARLYGKLTARRYDRKHKCIESAVELEYSHKFTCPLMPKIQPCTEYDLAVSFLTPHYFVSKKVRAKKKIAWIHTDYSKIQVDIPSETAMWGSYDKIASISANVTENFCKIFPELQEKVMLVENILPSGLILSQASVFDAGEEISGTDIVLLSIGRYCNAKNFDNVPDICRRLVKAGLDVKWYLIGFGGAEALIRNKISEAGMEKRVILLGKKENPYPYIKACDVYVQPSRYEGKSVTVREAQMLGKPVVITRYATSSSQLEDGIDGVIVPMDNEGCTEGIAEVIHNRMLREQLQKNMKQRDYAGTEEVEKLYRLME